MSRLTEIGGKRLPFLRWSALRMMFGMRRLTTEWQVGDGREEALGEYVVANARGGRRRRTPSTRSTSSVTARA